MPRAKRPQRPRQAADEARSVHAQLRPPSIERAIARPQLERALTRATAPIVWLHAPAGAGKTLGLAHFVARHNAGCLWYGLDAEDRDPGNLVAALGLALAGDLGSVQPPRLAPIPESAFELEVRRLFRTLFARAEQPVHLALDKLESKNASAMGRLPPLDRADPVSWTGGLSRFSSRAHVQS